jgi:hypothetical protein
MEKGMCTAMSIAEQRTLLDKHTGTLEIVIPSRCWAVRYSAVLAAWY